jgi:hypothetical protein
MADDALHPGGEDRSLHGYLFGLLVVDETTDLRVLAFRIFTYYHHVDIAAPPSGERRIDTVE